MLRLIGVVVSIGLADSLNPTTIAPALYLASGEHARARVTEYDEMTDPRPDHHPDPEALLLQQQTVDRVRRAVESLPVDFREVVVLRELEGLSYKEIADVIGIPMGTVMSRLSRARERLISVLGPMSLAGETR